MTGTGSGLWAGTARVEITPSQPISMGGFGQRAGKVSVGVHDPLYAKALFLRENETNLLILTTDLISLPESICRKVIKALVKEKIARQSEICITASHTHSGPDVDSSIIIAAPVKGYIQDLIAKLIQVGAAAAAKPVPVKLKMAIGEVNFLVNRRQTDRNDLVDNRTLAIELDVVEGNRPLAVLFGVGCHPVCLGHDNLLISADYPGFAQKMLEEKLGVENALFVNCTEGNVIPSTRPIFNSLDTRGYLGGTFEDAAEIGNALAAAVLLSLQPQGFQEIQRFVVKKQIVSIQPAHRQDSVLESFKEMLRNRKTILEYMPDFRKASIINLKPIFTLWRDASDVVVSQNMTEAEMQHLMSAVSSLLVMAMRLTNPNFRKDVAVTLQTIQINDYHLATLPGEVLVEVGKDWQNRNYPVGSKAFVIGLANGFMGYLPHPTNFEEINAVHKYETIMNALEQQATLVLMETAEEMVKGN